MSRMPPGASLTSKAACARRRRLKFFADALAGGGYGFDGGEIESSRVDQRLDEFEQLAARFRIARGHACL